jgi:hypothetical protein
MTTCIVTMATCIVTSAYLYTQHMFVKLLVLL